DGFIFSEIGRDHQQVRAEPNRARHRHRRPHTEPPRLIAGGRDDTPACGRTANGDGLSPERLAVALLDGSVERIHVDVQDAAEHVLAPNSWLLAPSRTLRS